MTDAGGRGQATGPGKDTGDLRIGVVLEAFLDWPLEQVLSWLPRAAPEITCLEVVHWNENAEPFVWTKKKVRQRRFKGRRITQL